MAADDLADALEEINPDNIDEVEKEVEDEMNPTSTVAGSYFHRLLLPQLPQILEMQQPTENLPQAHWHA